MWAHSINPWWAVCGLPSHHIILLSPHLEGIKEALGGLRRHVSHKNRDGSSNTRKDRNIHGFKPLVLGPLALLLI